MVKFDLPMVEGVWVSSITEGGSAEGAGIRRDDVIVAVNGIKTASMPALQEQVARFRPGQSIDVDLIRGGRKIRKSAVTLKALSSSSSAYRR
jgi:S1-C subfamily serine protease